MSPGMRFKYEKCAVTRENTDGGASFGYRFPRISRNAIIMMA
jgi:hypothetical protein